MITYIHIRIVYNTPSVYLPITAPIDSGKYFPIRLFNSGTVLYFTNVNILRNISTIAIAYTNDENLLNTIATTINKTTMIIASIYILNTTYNNNLS